jgi:hypothetical protein
MTKETHGELGTDRKLRACLGNHIAGNEKDVIGEPESPRSIVQLGIFIQCRYIDRQIGIIHSYMDKDTVLPRRKAKEGRVAVRQLRRKSRHIYLFTCRVNIGPQRWDTQQGHGDISLPGADSPFLELGDFI